MCALWAFLPEFSAGPNHFNDLSLHGGILQQMKESSAAGGSIFDFWFDGSPFGYPLFRAYQSLPHLTMYGVYKLLGESVPIWSVLVAFTTLLACVQPWSVCFLARKIGFSAWPAACAGALSILVSEAKRYGMGMDNYSWGTLGLITQLWGIVFLAPALGFIIDFLRSGRGFAFTLAFVFLSFGSHILCAYLMSVVAGSAVVVLALLAPRMERDSAQARNAPAIVGRRAVALVVGGICVTLHQWITMVLDAPYIHRSIHEPSWKFISHGIEWCVHNLFRGAIFDDGRFPSLSVMVAGGTVACLWDLARGTQPLARVRAAILLLSFGILFSLLCGVEVWGVTGIFSLPIFNAMHLHRMIVGVQLVGLLLAAAFFERVLTLKVWPEFFVAVFLVALGPMLDERHARFTRAHGWIAAAQPQEQMKLDVEALVQELRAAPRGWVFAGKAAQAPFQIAPSMPLFYRLEIEGIPTLGMLFHSMSLAADVIFTFDPESAFSYRILGVRYVVQSPSWTPPPFLAVRQRYQSFVLYEYPESGVVDVGTLYAAGSGSATSKAHYINNWIASARARSGSFGEIFPSDKAAAQRDPGLVGALDGPVDTSESVPLRATVVSSSREQQRISSEVVFEESGIVIFKVGYHPSWVADVDGVSVPTTWVTPGFLAVEVSPGRHMVRARYEPWRGKGVVFLLCLLVPVLSLSRIRRWFGLKG